MKLKLRKMWQVWDNFWFGHQNAYALSLFRLAFGSTILIMYIIRHLQVEFFYFDSGLLPWSAAQQVLPPFFKPPFQWFPQTDFAVLILHSTFLASILVMTLGVFGRWFNVIVLFLHLTFIYRNPLIIYGADIVTSFFLFYFCFADSRAYFSVANWFRNPGEKKTCAISESMNSLATRLFQIQLCVIYGYTGMEKLKGTPWWDGTALWSAVTNSQLAPMDFTWLSHWPILIILGTYFTLLFEIYFPVLIWNKSLRPWILLAGVLFHVGIAASMGLVFFSAVMLCSYLFFMDLKKVRPSFW